jgi:YD repeat-containing protein
VERLGTASERSDSWSGVTWQFHVDSTSRRVTSIDVAGRSDILWTYAYDANGQLLSVSAPAGSPWRTYEYGSWGMTAARDPLGNLIESHTYDTNGSAISSTGSHDEIGSIQYGLGAPDSGDTLTRVTTHNGATIDYVLRPVGGAYRTVHVIGGCTSCGSHDAIYAYDDDGHVVRQQTANGYITATTYTNNHVTSVQRYLTPTAALPRPPPTAVV